MMKRLSFFVFLLSPLFTVCRRILFVTSSGRLLSLQPNETWLSLSLSLSLSVCSTTTTYHFSIRWEPLAFVTVVRFGVGRFFAAVRFGRGFRSFLETIRRFFIGCLVLFGVLTFPVAFLRGDCPATPVDVVSVAAPRWSLPGAL